MNDPLWTTYNILQYSYSNLVKISVGILLKVLWLYSFDGNGN